MCVLPEVPSNKNGIFVIGIELVKKRIVIQDVKDILDLRVVISNSFVNENSNLMEEQEFH